MASKKYQPKLLDIPEEQTILYESSIVPATASASRRSSLISSTKDSSKKSIVCSGCPGCEKKSDVSVPNCKNCGDKQNSIRKWLENVSSINEESVENVYESKTSNDKLGKHYNLYGQHISKTTYIEDQMALSK